MLYELKLNNDSNNEFVDLLNRVDIIKISKKNVINQDFYDKLTAISHYLNDRTINNHNINILNPYYYLNKIIKKPIYFFIFKEMFNKFSFNIEHSLLFSNSINNINSIIDVIPNIKICTKNKFYNSTKIIFHDYNNFINKEKHNYYNTIIINYEDYNVFIRYILLALVVQKEKGTLILNVPSVTTNIIISLINLIMKFYNITIIKPFASYIHSTERYIICENYKNSNNENTFNFVKNCLNKINEKNYNEFIINIENIREIEYFYLKQIIHDNSIWGTYVLNILNKFLIDENLENSHNENHNTVVKWLELLS